MAKAKARVEAIIVVVAEKFVDVDVVYRKKSERVGKLSNAADERIEFIAKPGTRDRDDK